MPNLVRYINFDGFGMRRAQAFEIGALGKDGNRFSRINRDIRGTFTSPIAEKHTSLNLIYIIFTFSKKQHKITK